MSERKGDGGGKGIPGRGGPRYILFFRCGMQHRLYGRRGPWLIGEGDQEPETGRRKRWITLPSRLGGIGLRCRLDGLGLDVDVLRLVRVLLGLLELLELLSVEGRLRVLGRFVSGDGRHVGGQGSSNGGLEDRRAKHGARRAVNTTSRLTSSIGYSHPRLPVHIAV